jgi:predicted DNA-binding protein
MKVGNMVEVEFDKEQRDYVSPDKSDIYRSIYTHYCRLTKIEGEVLTVQHHRERLDEQTVSRKAVSPLCETISRRRKPQAFPNTMSDAIKKRLEHLTKRTASPKTVLDAIESLKQLTQRTIRDDSPYREIYKIHEEMEEYYYTENEYEKDLQQCKTDMETFLQSRLEQDPRDEAKKNAGVATKQYRSLTVVKEMKYDFIKKHEDKIKGYLEDAEPIKHLRALYSHHA